MKAIEVNKEMTKVETMSLDCQKCFQHDSDFPQYLKFKIRSANSLLLFYVSNCHAKQKSINYHVILIDKG